jgi:hypothetical protein
MQPRDIKNQRWNIANSTTRGLFASSQRCAARITDGTSNTAIP